MNSFLKKYPKIKNKKGLNIWQRKKAQQMFELRKGTLLQLC